MPSVRKVLKWIFVLGPAVSAAPAPSLYHKPASLAPRAAQPAAAAGALTDVDILQFALTAEHLESTFYQMGFAKFPASDFMAAGLTQSQVDGLMMVGATEAIHVDTLLSAIAGAGTAPVQPCQYNFGFTDAKGMLATAQVLEAVGVSAYLGAAPLINSSAILGTAATIATVESRHQTFIRSAGGSVAVPAAFDTPLGPRGVFTLAAQFITSCPPGSNLNVQAFPSIKLDPAPTNMTAGMSLVLKDMAQPSGAAFCGFINQGNTQFTQLNGGSCTVPPNMAGEVYMTVTNKQAVTDDVILAGPAVIIMS